MPDESFDDIRKKLLETLHRNGTSEPPQEVEPPPEPPPNRRITSPMDVWRVRVAKVVEADCEKAGNLTYQHTEPELLVDSAANYALTIIRKTGLLPPEETDLEQEVRNIASGVVQGYLDRYQEQLPDSSPAREVIVYERADQAQVSNDEYLNRRAIVEALYYEQAISLGVGGKHEGKTTDVRTEALAIAAGEPVYDRATFQMPVIYAASDEEYPTTRMELLNMGWLRRKLPLVMVKIKTQESPEPEEVLAQLARMAMTEGSRFIVLDMLFDFIRVQDENKYAQTRQAISHIQTLADEIGGHVRATHHSPKWMLDVTQAAKAALGSQGIVAKFSPILLSRKWADDLFTIESTMTRDPRGRPLKPLCLIRDAEGWARPNGEFKQWMKWRMYVERILGLFEGQEGKIMSVRDVSEALALSKHETGNALLQMTKGDDAPLDRRRGRGASYLYFLKVHDLFNQPEI